MELPGIKEPERVRKLLQGTASLEFWSTYNNREIYPMLESINNRLAQTGAIDTPDTTAAEVVDSMVQADALASCLDFCLRAASTLRPTRLISQTISLFSKLDARNGPARPEWAKVPWWLCQRGG